MHFQYFRIANWSLVSRHGMVSDNSLRGGICLWSGRIVGVSSVVSTYLMDDLMFSLLSYAVTDNVANNSDQWQFWNHMTTAIPNFPSEQNMCVSNLGHLPLWFVPDNIEQSQHEPYTSGTFPIRALILHVRTCINLGHLLWLKMIAGRFDASCHKPAPI